MTLAVNLDWHDLPLGPRLEARLGIPTIVDRCVQAMVKNALEPFWEARFEGISYGFRPGRGCHDAIENVCRCGTYVRIREAIKTAAQQLK